jgi:hypothetical protein
MQKEEDGSIDEGICKSLQGTVSPDYKCLEVVSIKALG